MHDNMLDDDAVADPIGDKALEEDEDAAMADDEDVAEEGAEEVEDEKDDG